MTRKVQLLILLTEDHEYEYDLLNSFMFSQREFTVALCNFSELGTGAFQVVTARLCLNTRVL